MKRQHMFALISGLVLTIIITTELIGQETTSQRISQFKLDGRNKSFYNVPSVKDLWSQMESDLPSAPVDLMQMHLSSNRSMVARCKWMPAPWKLNIVNQQWQQFKTDSGVITYLYSAFYDDRKYDATSVRILLMSEDPRLNGTESLRCLTWYGDELKPDVTKVTDSTMTWTGGTTSIGVNPFLLSCPVAKRRLNSTEYSAPLAVSLAESSSLMQGKCRLARLTNALKIENRPLQAKTGLMSNNSAQQQTLAVCVKGVSFSNPDMAIRIVEWIELLLLLGVDKIIFHYTNVADEILDALWHYEAKGKVIAKKYTWAGPFSEEESLHTYYRKSFDAMTKQDNIPYNDCLYRYMRHFKYISILDVDEVIMPLKHKSLPEMLKHLEGNSSISATTHFRFRNTYFMGSMLEAKRDEIAESIKDVPPYMHMLTHLVRSVKHVPKRSVPKSIMKTDSHIHTTIGHYPVHCFGTRMRCPPKHVDVNFGHMAHYREGCQLSQANICAEYTNDTVVDLAIVRFKDRLIKNVNTTLKSIGMLP